MIALKNSLSSLVKGTKTITDFFELAKSKADEIALMDSPSLSNDY